MIYKVSDLNRVVKNYLESNLDLRDIMVEGEVSNITYHSSGHLYFTLKDRLACLKCALFSYAHKSADLNVKEGDSVKVLGRVTIYSATGQYQMVCDSLSKKGKEGDLYEKFQLLKEKLRKKGYFSDDIKKPIPFSLNIGVVTSDKGAVIRDIITTAKRKFSNINITLYPAKVQGDGADLEIIEGIKFFNGRSETDVIIVGRGGGSFEDLNCFNSEALADAIYESPKPIVSAVGHETDYVISDMVADLRAATPTQAAEIVTPNRGDLEDLLSQKGDKLSGILLSLVDEMRNSLEFRSKSYILRSLPDEVSNARISLDQHNLSINRKMLNILDSCRIKIENSGKSLSTLLRGELEISKSNLLSKISMVKNLNPLTILERGYSTTYVKDKILLDSVKGVDKGMDITTKLMDGEIVSRVEKVMNKK